MPSKSYLILVEENRQTSHVVKRVDSSRKILGWVEEREGQGCGREEGSMTSSLGKVCWVEEELRELRVGTLSPWHPWPPHWLSPNLLPPSSLAPWTLGLPPGLSFLTPLNFPSPSGSVISGILFLCNQ